jgi:signal transduction histidine kinase
VRPFDGTNSHIFFPIIYFGISSITYSIIAAFLRAKKESEKVIAELNSNILMKAQMTSLIKMAKGMAHEINNPLAIVVGKTDRLIDDLKTDRKTKENLIADLEKIRKSSFRISKIIRSLLNFSEGSFDERAGVHSLNEILMALAEFAAVPGGHRSIEIKIECPENLQIYTKKDQLKQALLNLINNSIDAVENLPEKWIQINCRETAKGVVISVTDSGKGIPKELHDKIMLPFFTTKDVGKGSGMGLSVAFGIVKSLDGQISYDESSPNTCFNIVLKKSG